MANLTVHNLPKDILRALCVQAVQHGRSTEAEVRAILANAVKPEQRLLMGDALEALGRKIGVTDDDGEALNGVHSKTPAEPMKFERSSSIPM